MINIKKASIAIITALISILPAYATEDCCDGKVKKDPCGCVDPSYKCCTAGEKNTAEQTYQTALVQSETTYADELEAQNNFYTGIRTDAMTDRESTVAAAEAAYAASQAYCASGYDQATSLGAIGYDACIAIRHALSDATVNGAWVFYYERVLVANAAQAAEGQISSSQKNTRNATSLSTKLATCSNW